MEEGSGEVAITINRAGNLLDDISVSFVAGEILGATGAAIGKRLMENRSSKIDSIIKGQEVHGT